MNEKYWYVYETGPVDWWDAWLAADEWIIGVAHGSRHDEQDHCVGLRMTPTEQRCRRDEWASAVCAVIQRTTWEGDGVWMVSAWPRPDQCDSPRVFAVKQSNNGTCFFACCAEMPWLGKALLP